MNFTKLRDGINCDCLEGSIIDINNPYLRRTFTQVPTLKDFESYHEHGKVPKENCSSICGYRGVSLYLCSDETKHLVIEKQRKTIKERKAFSPRAPLPNFGYLFTFKEGAGMVKQTGNDTLHHDFYKTDEFTLQSLLEVEVINLDDV